MRIFHPHYHKLGKTHSKIVSLFFALIVLSGLLFSLFSFNIAVYMVKEGIANFEKETNTNVHWEKIALDLSPTISVYNLNIDDGFSPKKILNVPYISIKINLKTFFRMLFTDFKKVLPHRKLDFEKKNMNFLLVKSIEAIHIDYLDLDFYSYQYEPIVKKVLVILFKKRALSKQAQVLLSMPQLRIDYGNTEAMFRFRELRTNLHQDRGVHIAYDGKVQVNMLATRYETFFSGNSNLYNIRDLKFTHELQTEEIVLNRYLAVKPLNLEINNDAKILNLELFHKNTSILSMRSAIEDSHFTVNSQKLNFLLNDLISLDQDTPFYSLLQTRIGGTFNYFRNAQSGNSNYALRVKNIEDTADFLVDLDVEGNETRLKANTFTLLYQDQVLRWNGAIDLRSWIPEGRAELLVEKPFLVVPLQASIHFLAKENTSSVEIFDFKMHNIPQSNYTILYNPSNSYFQIFEEGIMAPIIESFVVSSATTAMNNKTLRNARNRVLEKRLSSLKFNDFNLKILDGLLFNNEKIHFFSSLLLNGEIDLIMDSVELDEFSYQINVKNLSSELFNIDSSGNYTQENGLIIQGILSIPDFLEANFSTGKSRGINIKEAKDMQMEIQLAYSMPDLDEVTTEVNAESLFKAYQDLLLLKGSYKDEKLSLRLNDMFVAELIFQRDELRKMNASFTSFTLSGMQSTINGTINASMHENSLSSFESDIAITKKDMPLFDSQIHYQDGAGEIDSFNLYTKHDTFKGKGNFNYYPKTKNFAYRITDSNKLVGTSSTERSLHGTYNHVSRTLFLALKNISPAFFTRKISGAVSGTVAASLNFSYAEFFLQRSEIILNETNTRFFAAGNVRITPETVNITTADLKSRDLHLAIDTATIHKKGFTVSSRINSVGYANQIPGIQLDLRFASKDSILTLFRSEDTLKIPELEGTVTLLPFFEEHEKPFSQYKHSIYVESKENYILFEEKNNKFFFSKTRDGDVMGRIGNSSLPWNIRMGGRLKNDEISIRFDIVKLDLPPIIQDFHLNDLIPIALEQGIFFGSFFVRGSFNDPKFYANIDSSPILFQHPILEDSVYIDNLSINMNDSKISLSNAYLKSNATVVMNGKGYFDKYSIGNLRLDFYTFEDTFVNVSELQIASVHTSGFVRGTLSVDYTPDVTNLTGKLFLRNTTVYMNEEKQEEAEISQEKFYVDITLVSDKQVGYYWPNPSFPLLKSHLQRDQELRIIYDSYDNFTELTGKLALQSGTLYYHNKRFAINSGTVHFDTGNYDQPFIRNFEAQMQRRINNENYTILLSADTAFFNDINFQISSFPYLSTEEIDFILGSDEGNAYVLSEHSLSDTPNPMRRIANLSSNLSNIGVVSRFEESLAHALDVDYISFKTKIFENWITDSLLSGQNNRTLDGIDSLVSLIDGTSVEIGKYLNLAYLSFIFQVKENEFHSLSVNNFLGNLSVSTKFNVEIPTPILNVGWSFDPSVFSSGDSRKIIPVNSILLSWHRRY